MPDHDWSLTEAEKDIIRRFAKSYKNWKVGFPDRRSRKPFVYLDPVPVGETDFMLVLKVKNPNTNHTRVVTRTAAPRWDMDEVGDRLLAAGAEILAEALDA